MKIHPVLVALGVALLLERLRRQDTERRTADQRAPRGRVLRLHQHGRRGQTGDHHR